MLTLWDLVKDVAEAVRGGGAAPARRPAPVAPSVPSRARAKTQGARRGPAPGSMDERYQRLTQEMLERFGVRVRRWRTSMSGMAWEVRYTNGTRTRLIEAPRPRGPMSMAIFLHEIGHHAIGFDRYKPRCLEEYHAWAWAVGTMRELGLNVTAGVDHRMRESLWYAVSKARRRGLRDLPPELEPFQTRPPRRRRLTARSAPC